MRGGIAASLRHNRSTHITHGSGAQRTSEIRAHSAENGLISACRITHSSKTAFELYTSQCKKRFCQVRRSHSGLYSRASVEPSTGWRVRMFGCETSGGRLCWLRCCQPHRRSKTGTIFFYGLVIKGVASPPPGISCRPRKSVGGVWLTILLHRNLPPGHALVVTSARVCREPEWVFWRPSPWDAPRRSGANQGSGWRSPPGFEPGDTYTL